MNVLRTIFLLLISIFACKNTSQEKAIHNPIKSNQTNRQLDTFNYIDFSYDKVIAFATVDPYVFMRMDSNKIEWQRGGTDTISVTLNSNQIENLKVILNGNTKTKESEVLPADCFYPRHNIIFTDKDNNIVNYLSICFECGNREASKPSKAKWKDLEDFYNTIGLKVFDRPDYYKRYYDSLNKKHYH